MILRSVYDLYVCCMIFDFEENAINGIDCAMDSRFVKVKRALGRLIPNP